MSNESHFVYVELFLLENSIPSSRYTVCISLIAPNRWAREPLDKKKVV